MPRILAIYPEPNRRRTLRTALEGSGVELLTAPTISVGVAKLEQNPVDLVVLDLDVGGLSVTELDALASSIGGVRVIGVGGDSHTAALAAKHGVLGLSSVGRGQEAGLAGIARQLDGSAPVSDEDSSPGEAEVQPPPAGSRPAPIRKKRARIDAVAIGVSTGGPNALLEVLPLLPKEPPVPMFVVQHMPEAFLPAFAEQLDARCPAKVRLGAAGMLVESGVVYLAPGNRHMVVEGVPARLQLLDEPPEHNCRPAVDPMFRSVAAYYRQGCLAVVMTGMGADGSGGVVPIAEAGGTVYIQDEESSVVWGMPGAVARSGVDYTEYPLDQLGGAITRAIAYGRSEAQQ